MFYVFIGLMGFGLGCCVQSLVGDVPFKIPYSLPLYISYVAGLVFLALDSKWKK
jgi:hypothetical protein